MVSPQPESTRTPLGKKAKKALIPADSEVIELSSDDDGEEQKSAWD